MKKLFGLLLFSTVVLAQSVPNGAIVQGQIWTPAQWNTAWQVKTDYPTYPQTSSEVVPPVSFIYPPGHAWRYGIDPTNTIDSTAAMVVAHATGYRIYYPKGTYKISAGSAIPVLCGGIVGDGPMLTVFNVVSSGANNIFQYTCPTAGDFENFQVQTSSMSGGYALTVTAASGENTNTKIRNVFVTGAPNCISFIAASQWVVDALGCYNFTGDGITVNNTNNADSGDSTVSNSNFFGSGGSSNGIHQLESGGLKALGSKFNSYSGLGLGVGILLDLGAFSTSDLVVVGNSFENAHFSAIQMQRTSGSATFGNVAIVGNQLLVNSSTGNSTGIFTNNGASFLSNVTVVGNVIKDIDTGTTSAITLDYVAGATLSGNTLLGTGGSSVGILIGTHGSNVTVGVDNTVSGFTTNFSGATGVNGLVVGNASGGQQGAGTLNATQLYNAGSLVAAANQSPTWTGNHTFHAAAGTAVTVAGVSNSYGVKVDGGPTSGQSLGLFIDAGTTSADFALRIQNQANTLTFFKVVGDGGVVVGAAVDEGIGTLNAVQLFQAGVPLASSATTDTTNATNISSGTVASARLPASSVTLAGTSGSIGGGALIAGQCASGTATVTSATTSMVALADPNTYPGDGTVWDAQVTSANTVTVKVCAIIALTPTSSTYNIRVLQ